MLMDYQLSKRLEMSTVVWTEETQMTMPVIVGFLVIFQFFFGSIKHGCTMYINNKNRFKSPTRTDGFII